MSRFGPFLSPQDCFQVLERCRQERSESEQLQLQYIAVKRFQTDRFRRTYIDLLQSPAFSDALVFFLEELYGTQDFSERDRQFERIAPTVSQLFPSEVAETVERLVELHALSESLDLAMAREMGQVEPAQVAPAYAASWRRLACQPERFRQLGLVLQLGEQLAELTRRPLLRRLLVMMRLPAKAAGLEALQRFLERGFDSFAGLAAPQVLLCAIRERESAFILSMDGA